VEQKVEERKKSVKDII